MKHHLPLLALAALMLGLFACDPKGTTPTTTTAPTTAATGPRIVSMVPAATLNLVQIGAVDRLIGVTKYDSLFLPDGKQNLPVVGDYLDINYELLIQMRPTAVVIFAAEHRVPERLRQIADQQHFEIVNIKTDTIAELYTAIEKLGDISGRRAEADARIAVMKADLREIAEQYKDLPKVRVAYVSGREPPYIVGRDNFLDEMLRAAGGENVGATIGPGWPTISLELLIKLAPDVLLVGAPDEPEQIGPTDPRAQRWLRLPIPAAKAGKVFLVTDGNGQMPSLETPNHVRRFAQILHGEKPR